MELCKPHPIRLIIDSTDELFFGKHAGGCFLHRLRLEQSLENEEKASWVFLNKCAIVNSARQKGAVKGR